MCHHIYDLKKSQASKTKVFEYNYAHTLIIIHNQNSYKLCTFYWWANLKKVIIWRDAMLSETYEIPIHTILHKLV